MANPKNGVQSIGAITVDMLNNLRLADPDVTEQSNTLRAESDRFVELIQDLESRIGEIRTLFRNLGELADHEKMRVMNATDELRVAEERGIGSAAEAREIAQLQAAIFEKNAELEMANAQLENLKQIEAKQNDYLRRLQLSD